MSLQRILALLVELEAEGKLVSYTLPALYDANGDIHLTVRAVDVPTREAFLAAVAQGDESAAESEPETVEAAEKPKGKRKK